MGGTSNAGRILTGVLCGPRSIGSMWLVTAWVSAAILAHGSPSQALAQASTPRQDLAAQLARPAPTANQQAVALQRLEEAMALWDDENWISGAHLADSALSMLPALADWRPLVLAELLAPAGDTVGVRAAAAQLDRTHEYWSRWGWDALARVYEEADLPATASEVARAQARAERNPGRASAAWARAGSLAVEAGDSVRAREDLWSALDFGADYQGAREAALLIAGLGGAIIDASDELRLGRALLAAREWDRADSRLSGFLGPASSLSEDEQAELRLALGRARFELRRYADAEATLDPLTTADTGRERRSEALYWKGRSLLARGAVLQAESTLRALAESDPESRWAERGWSEILSRELETGFGPRARGFLDELLRVGVSSRAIGSTVVELGSTLYLSRDYLTAATTFEQYLQGTRGSSNRQQAGYWAGLSHERAGREPDSRARLAEVYEEDPLTYYGVFAGERIDAPVLSADLPEGPAPSSLSRSELANAILRLRVHRLVPTTGSFAYELDRLTDYFSAQPGGAYDFAEALIEGGFPLEAIVLGRRIHSEEGSWNLRLLRIVHPLPFRDIVVREASRYGLDPFFVAGLIRQESAFDAGIQSSSGAVGLMQLMPPTARELSGSLGLDYSFDALSDPDYNVRLGTRYLADLVRRFAGRAEEVLSAYNAGPSRMRAWRRVPEYQDRDVFLEHIPFQQTRNYVKLVQQYARIYSALYGCGSFEPCLGLSYPSLVARSSLAGGSPRIALTRD